MSAVLDAAWPFKMAEDALSFSPVPRFTLVGCCGCCGTPLVYFRFDMDTQPLCPSCAYWAAQIILQARMAGGRG